MRHLSLALLLAVLIPSAAFAQDEDAPGAETTPTETEAPDDDAAAAEPDFADAAPDDAPPAAEPAAAPAPAPAPAPATAPAASAPAPAPGKASARAGAASKDSDEPPPGPVVIVVVPRDPGANEAAAALEAALVRFADEDGRIRPVDLLEALGGEPDYTGPQRPEIVERFEKGKEAYDNLDLETAANEYIEGIKLMREDATTTAPAAMSRGLALAGAAFLLNGAPDKAAALFRRAGLISPKWAPDPDEFSPDILTAFNEAKQSIADGPKGSLTVTSNVTPTFVLLDGTYAGVAPLTLKDVPAGEHHVVCESRGHKPWGTLVKVVEGGGSSAAAELRPLPEADRFRRALEIAIGEMGGTKPGFGAQDLASAVGARYVILATALSGATAGAAVDVVAYDLGRQRRALGLKKTCLPGSPTFDADARSLGRQLIDELAKPYKLVVEEERAREPIYKKSWFWPVVGAVGGALVVGAVTATVVATTGGGSPQAPSLITTGIP